MSVLGVSLHYLHCNTIIDFHQKSVSVFCYKINHDFSWTIFQDFVRAGFITNVTSSTVQEFGSRMQLRYHRNTDGTIFMIPDDMEKGEFV